MVRHGQETNQFICYCVLNILQINA
uniref:Uncharacterized protein n=1 Tax=Rhizophora mucronata TaxID=61149 RepID=A0A2P2MZU3_RHIMU